MPPRTDIGRRIETRRAPRVAPADARNRQPPPAPRPVSLDGVEGVLRACRQVPALEADEWLQCPPVDVDGCLRETDEDGSRSAHGSESGLGRSRFGAAAGFETVERAENRLERQERRRMAALDVANGLENAKIGPLA